MTYHEYIFKKVLEKESRTESHICISADVRFCFCFTAAPEGFSQADVFD